MSSGVSESLVIIVSPARRVNFATWLAEAVAAIKSIPAVITGVKRQQAIGKPCCEVFRASICETACALRKTLTTGRPVVNKAVYILDATGNRLPISISTAAFKDESGKTIGGVETFRDLSLAEDLRKELEAQYSFAEIVGRSPSMRQVFQLLPQIAESDSTVLIEGASGTGKELFAKAIHKLSRRRDKRFVAINCAALPDTLLESELFGYKAGAFTDARQDKLGRFAIADGGTLLLDEIGDISPANWDLVGNNTPVFFLRDPLKFPDLNHAVKRDPRTNLRSARNNWDFWTSLPEALHQVTIVMSDRGIPTTYRHMHGFGSHTFSLINAKNERYWVKFHLKSQQGIKNLTDAEAEAIVGKCRESHQRDLYESIEKKDFPRWTMFIQIMPEKEAANCPYNPFDLTKVWFHQDYPLIEVGVLELNRNPENYFAEVEQSAFNPANIVPGIGFRPTRCCKGGCSPMATPNAIGLA